MEPIVGPALIKDFRDGIFALHTRRFGTIAELMIESLYNLDPPLNQFHDRYDRVHNQRVEIKFSTVLKANEAPITRRNAIEQCTRANLAYRVLKSTEVNTYGFDCNIQQVKCEQFDVLYYGLFFADQIQIFKMDSRDVPNCPGYSDKQHFGNVGEGQFHINPATLGFHQAHCERCLTYENLYNLFQIG